MRFVHTFWSKPFLKGYFNKYQTLLPVILTDYAYSVGCVKEFGHSIKLFTDKFGAELLGYIPYDEVVIFDDLENENVNFAAQIKFKALEKMELDEILVDGDLFLQNEWCFNHIGSLCSDVVYSFDEPESYTLQEETAKPKYDAMLAMLIAHNDEFDNTYRISNYDTKYYWHNTSLLKFNSEALKKEYVRQYWKNKSILENEELPIWPDIWIEQKNLTFLTERESFTCCPVVYGYPNAVCNDYCVLIGFAHLGSAKASFTDLLLTRLKTLSPVLYKLTQNQIEKYKNKKYIDLYNNKRP